MGFVSFVRRLLPKENKFFDLFTTNVGNIESAAQNLRKLLDAESEAERKILISQIEDAEHRGDLITHEIFNDVSQTFITPIDREDIHALAARLDDILDLMEDVALRTVLYEVTTFPNDFRDLADMLCVAVKDLSEVVPLLSSLKSEHVDRIKILCEHINTCENAGDDIYHNAIARLFREQKDPIMLIKLKEILSDMEEAIDKCEHVANLIESVVIKYA
jgi:predicted phosphate transport protein (TIGR00153 family)